MEVPLWKDVIKKFADKISTSVNENFDDLFLLDLYRDSNGHGKYENILSKSLPDDILIPGLIHHSLKKIPLVEYIITTNNIDTLLDKVYYDSHKIIEDKDVADYDSIQTEIIYLHGHRSKPNTWIFSRTDYEELNTNFPVKTALVRSLLVQYPSLFIGFGHTDPDLHSIMRFVDKTVKNYKPSILSLAIEKPNDALKKHWEKIGLNICTVNSFGGNIQESLINVLNYIAFERFKKMSELNIVVPGNRVHKSNMENIKENLHRCRIQNKNIFFCDYHLSRNETFILRIDNEKLKLVSSSPFTSNLYLNNEIKNVIKKLLSTHKTPSGSWGFMPSHRNWLFQGFNLFEKKQKRKNKTLKISILGIASLPHFIDTTSLIIEFFNIKYESIEITIYDKCIGPIGLIKDFFTRKNSPITFTNELYKIVFQSYKNNKIKLLYNHIDILKIKEPIKSKANICLSHHLVSFWGIKNSIKLNQYSTAVKNMMVRNGILISALNISVSAKIEEDTRQILNHNKVLSKNKLELIDSKLTFDLFDLHLDKELLKKEMLQVRKETLLTIHNRI